MRRFYDAELRFKPVEAEDPRGPFTRLDEPEFGMRLTLDPRIFEHDNLEVYAIIFRRIRDAIEVYYQKEKS